MITKVLVEKTFENLGEVDSAKYLNVGDVFLPNGIGWEFKVVKKVCHKDHNNPNEYCISVMVKPLSSGARKYAECVNENL